LNNGLAVLRGGGEGPKEQGANVAEETHLGAPKFVLIVEDDEALSGLIPQVLMKIWPSSQTVYGVASTLAQAKCIIEEKGNVPDLLILDLYLSDSEGLGTLDAMVNIIPPTSGILVMSAYLSHIEGKDALARGATRFLTKQGKFDTITIIDMAGRTWMATKGLRLRMGIRSA